MRESRLKDDRVSQRPDLTAPNLQLLDRKRKQTVLPDILFYHGDCGIYTKGIGTN